MDFSSMAAEGMSQAEIEAEFEQLRGSRFSRGAPMAVGVVALIDVIMLLSGRATCSKILIRQGVAEKCPLLLSKPR